MVFYYGVRWCASSGARPCVGPGTLLSTSLAGGDKDPTWAFGCILSPLFSLSPLSHPSLISLPSSFPSPLLHVRVPLFLYRFPFPSFGSSSPLLAWFPGWRFSSRALDWAAAKIDLVRAVCWPDACGSNLHLHHFVHPLLLYTCVCVCIYVKYDLALSLSSDHI